MWKAFWDPRGILTIFTDFGEDFISVFGSLLVFFVKFILIAGAIGCLVFAFKSLPQDLKDLWACPWWDWPALWASTDSILQFLPALEIGVLAGLILGLVTHSYLVGYFLGVLGVGYLICLVMNLVTLIGSFDTFGLGTLLQIFIVVLLLPFLTIASVLPPLLLVTIPYVVLSLCLVLLRFRPSKRRAQTRGRTSYRSRAGTGSRSR